MSLPGLDRWYRVIKSHDRAELKAMLHPDVVFESPVVHTPQRGADITYKYLSSAIKVLNGESFRYLGEWRGDNSAVLEFATRSTASPSTVSTSSNSPTTAASLISR